MIREIQAKRLLAHHKEPDDWFGIQYNFNIYRGCEHQCIYCDSRSECYGIEDFRDVLVKVNAIDLLRDELPRKRRVGVIGAGSMSDPYTPVELHYGLTGQALRVIAEHRFPLHLITKSDLVVKDLEPLEQISRDTRAAVSFTLTTVDDGLARILEPGAPSPSARLQALATLVDHGVTAGVTMMPILPYVEDTPENVTAIIARAHQAGARYLLAGLGMTMRDRQRAYYYARLDEHFAGLRARYEQRYGERYSCPPDNIRALRAVVDEACARFGLPQRLEPWAPPPSPAQLRLL
jgi:DNA repair photolyase